MATVTTNMIMKIVIEYWLLNNIKTIVLTSAQTFFYRRNFNFVTMAVAKLGNALTLMLLGYEANNVMNDESEVKIEKVQPERIEKAIDIVKDDYTESEIIIFVLFFVVLFIILSKLYKKMTRDVANSVITT